MNKEKKKDLCFIIIFIIIVSLSLLYLFQASYAKYRKQIQGNVEAEIASWNILINNESIQKKMKLVNNIEPTFPGDTFTKASVIAPGSIGYFDIVIDATKVDVSFTYEITNTVAEESSVKDLKITSYIINPTDTNTTQITYNNNITGTINHNTGNTTIRIYITWDDSENNSMNNKEDTDVGVSETSKALITSSIKFSQIKE